MTTTQTPGWYPDPAGGPLLRWWDGYRWTDRTQPMPQRAEPVPTPGPQAPPPKEKRVWLRVLIVLGVLFLLGVGGCTALLAVGSKAVNDAVEQASVDQAMQQAEIDRDVTLGLCAPDKLGLLAASGTITNNSSKRSNYTVSVVFVEKDGRQVAEGFATVGNLEPGRKADWSASSLKRLTFTDCEIVEVTRFSDEP